MRGMGLIALFGVCLMLAPAAGAHEVTSGSSVAAFDGLTFAESALRAQRCRDSHQGRVGSEPMTAAATSTATTSASSAIGDREARRHVRTGLRPGVRGKLMVAGTYEGAGFFRIARRQALDSSRSTTAPARRATSRCSARRLRLDRLPSSNSEESPTCNNTATNNSQSSLGKEGMRIVDISDVRQPRQAGFVETECGSHTHTLIPGEGTRYIYVAVLPADSGRASATSSTIPEGEISVVEFPNGRPGPGPGASGSRRAPADRTPTRSGCHDIGVMPAQDLAVAACLGAWAVLDISDPGATRRPLRRSRTR